MKKRSQVLLLIATPLLIAALGVGSYLSYQSIQSQHEENLKDLERFGFTITPSSPYTESTGELGAKQLPATFAESELSPTQKVIYGLMKDKERLLAENRQLKARMETLEQKVGELEAYREINERFAPKTFDEEVTEVAQDLKTFLMRLPEAERFSDRQIDIMTAASAREYRRFVSQNRLMTGDLDRKRIVNEHLPGYAFCVGDAATIATNSGDEERMLAQYFRTDDSSRLSEPLRQDLQTVIEPCELALRKALDATL
ncbi:hypothetical protein [Marinobacterium aestuariivivens]|uniref:OmpH family outer membrane protein n=1 Tax=Marinobacterium aestuariivivens TaxID=1698799 RepID=A0ABW2A551_9GAMM